jgi:hypothetical protein
MLARGWERQLDQGRNGLFYGSEPLDAASYHHWLGEQAVSYVALSDAPLDYSAKAEAALVRNPSGGSGAYLREVWRSRHWRLFAVADPAPLVSAPARMTAVSSESFTLAVPAAGSYETRLRFTSYWQVSGGRGCVSEAPGGWTRVQARQAGFVHVVIHFSLGRILAHSQRCS